MPKYTVVVQTEVAQTEEQLVSMLAGTFGKGFVVEVEEGSPESTKIDDWVGAEDDA